MIRLDDEILDEELIEIPSRTYKVSNGRIAGYVDELDAMRQSVEKILSTERFAWSIYSDDYGSDVTDLVGEDIDLINSELERLILEVLSTDDRVVNVEDILIVQVSKDSILVNFTVQTVFGNVVIEQEVVV